MPFLPTIPQPGDLLSSSQGDLLANNGFLNTWSVTDHYALDDATVDNGKHKVLQMPVQATQPVTTVDPMFYSFEQSTGNQGIQQYMCQAGGLVQSPITPIQSSAAGIGLPATTVINIFDFTGSLYCYGTITGQALNGATPSGFMALFSWSGSQGTVKNTEAITAAGFQFAGAILQLNNNTVANFTNLAFTIKFDRIFTPL